MTIDFYYLPISAPSRSIIMTADILGIELNKKTLNLMAGEHMTPEFLKINPQHCIPTIVDDGFALWESRAILAYLVNQYAPNHSLYPNCPKKRAHIDRALYFDGTSLYASFGALVYPMIFCKAEFDKAVAEMLYKKLDILNTELDEHKFVAGDEVTIGDLSTLATVTSIFSVKMLETSKERFQKIYDWIERMKPHVKNWDEVVIANAKAFGEFIETRLQQV